MTNPQEQGISSSWSLTDFAHAHGKMQIGKFTNNQTGEQFKSCAFTAPDNTVTFVAFSSKLGEISPAEIARRKNDLQVAQLKESGNYVLCEKGANSWEDVDLGL